MESTPTASSRGLPAAKPLLVRADFLQDVDKGGQDIDFYTVKCKIVKAN
jgi:hypothetical protein